MAPPFKTVGVAAKSADARSSSCWRPALCVRAGAVGTDHRAAPGFPVQLPMMMVGAGRPELQGNIGRGKSYAEKQIEFREIGAVTPADAESSWSKDVIPMELEELGVRCEFMRPVDLLTLVRGDGICESWIVLNHVVGGDDDV